MQVNIDIVQATTTVNNSTLWRMSKCLTAYRLEEEEEWWSSGTAVLSTKYQPKDNQWCTLYTLTLSTKYERGDDQTTTIVYCERYVQICACNYVAPCIVVFVYIDVINNIRAGGRSTLLNAQWSRQYCKTIVCWEQCVTTSEGYQQDTIPRTINDVPS